MEFLITNNVTYLIISLVQLTDGIFLDHGMGELRGM